MDNPNSGDRRADEWLAGTAEAVITPDDSMWMAGYGAREEPSQAVHQDLYAKVLTLEDCAGNVAAICSVELLFVGRSLRMAVERRCEEEHGIDPERLLLNASHTHMGPVARTATREDPANTDRRIPKDEGSVNFIPFEKYGCGEQYRKKTLEYQKILEDSIVDLVGQALSEREPTELSFARGRCGSAMNRRRPHEDGIAFTPYSDGSVDHEVPVLIAEAPGVTGDEAVRALLFGYACHTTTQMINEFSGDWAGYTQRFLEERFSEATAIFLQGCGGDQKAYPQQPRAGGRAKEDQSYTEGHARAVALGVEAAIESVRRPVRGPLRAVYEDVPIAFEQPPSRESLEETIQANGPENSWREQHLLAVLEEYGEIPTEYPYPIQAIGFSTDLTMLALAGEVLVDYSLRLKEEIDGNVWVSGYSNNAFTYVPTRQALAEGGYEADRVINSTALPGKWKPDIEERIVSKSKTLAERVSTPVE